MSTKLGRLGGILYKVEAHISFRQATEAILAIYESPASTGQDFCKDDVLLLRKIADGIEKLLEEKP